MCDEQQPGFLRYLVLLLVLCSSACGAPPSTSKSSSSVRAGCEHRFAEQCHGFFTCQDAAFLMANAEVLGTSEAECSKISAETSCSTDCDSDRTYDASADMQCADQFASQSCDDVKNNVIPDPCLEICVKTAPSSGQGGSSAAP